MALFFRYKLLRAGLMLPSLGGRSVRPRPLVWVGLLGPTGAVSRTFLLDTGSDDTVIPDRVALLIGIDLLQLPVYSMQRPGGVSIPVRFANIILRLTDGKESREWPATVSFTSSPLPYPLLGFAGCLQYFTATFRGDVEEVELAVNALYPGT